MKAAIALLTVCIVTLIIVLVMSMIKQNADMEKNIGLLQVLIGTIEAEDTYLDGHSLYVHNLTMAFYDNLPIELRLRLNRDDLEYASLLLDVGKLCIPREIIGKKDALKDDEWDLIKKHPEIGLTVLGTLKGFERVSNWILYHHERVDGTGYHGLKGDEIPLASRMIAISDTYSAITMTRAYKPSMDYDEAISELRLSSGSQLDEELVEIFCRIPVDVIQKCLDDVREKIGRIKEENANLK